MNSLYKYHHSHNTTCFDHFCFFFSLQFMTWTFIFFQFWNFTHIFGFESQLHSLPDLEKSANTFPRCNICHVLYPDNWRSTTIVTKQFFFVLSLDFPLLLFRDVPNFLCGFSMVCTIAFAWLLKSLNLHENDITF